MTSSGLPGWTYSSHSELLRQNDPEYDRQYNFKETKRKLKASPEDNQLEIAQPERSAPENKRERKQLIPISRGKFDVGFAHCIEARMLTGEQTKLCEQFYSWMAPMEFVGCHFDMTSEYPRYQLSLNEVYDTNLGLAADGLLQIEQSWVPWTVVKKSTILKEGFGLFASRRFERGDTVGVYTAVPPFEHEITSTVDVQSVPEGIDDACGGTSSVYNYFLGAYFINDPAFTGASSTKKYNVEVHPDGRITATRRVNRGQEFFISYNCTGNDKGMVSC
jgi:hypothetical protein